VTPPLPPPPPGPAPDPAQARDATVVVDGVSVWFGPKVALAELTCSFGPGVTGLLGPNGAGKTTLMRAVAGTLEPNQGRVRVHGLDPRRDRAAQRHVALVPEDDAVPGALTARQLVAYSAALHRVPGRDVVDRALAAVALSDVADRRVGGFSKGMRQRAKVAAALVTGPSVLVLDEPLNGADPVQRLALIELFTALGGQGRTVVVSSHVLHEVERLADRQIVLVGGRLAAAGGRLAIREAMADRPGASGSGPATRGAWPPRWWDSTRWWGAGRRRRPRGLRHASGGHVDGPAPRRPGPRRPPARGPPPRRVPRVRLPGAAVTLCSLPAPGVARPRGASLLPPQVPA
jgi:ABC-2 type transport system ATP-binding protein